MSEGSVGDAPSPLQPPVSADAQATDFDDWLVHRLFSIGMSLEGAQSIVGAGPAVDRLAAAVSELDDVIRRLRTMRFESDGHRQATATTGQVAYLARRLQAQAPPTPGQLERQPTVSGLPARLDYPD